MQLFFSLKLFAISLYLIQNETSAIKRSLAFVFDTTGSMSDDLQNFKIGANIILNSYSEKPNIGISDFILVPFNDPGFGPVSITKDINVFRSKMNSIKVDGGDDCPEMCLNGIKLALEYVLPNSYIYVMTDASEKDTHLKSEVIRMAQSKQTQITFIFTGTYCSSSDKNTFSDIAEASFGQVFNLNDRQDILEVLKYTNEILNKDTIPLGYKQNPKGYDNKLEVVVDETVDKISLVVSGGHPKIEVVNPENVTVTDPKKVVKTLNLAQVAGVDVIDPEAGTWTIKYGSDDKHTLKVTGLSELELDYGFSRFKVKNISESTKEPSKGFKNSLIVAIKKGSESVKTLENVELVDTSGKLLKRISLRNIFNSENGKVYETDEFYPPEGLFVIKINGVDKSGNKISRVSETAIQNQDPDAPVVTTENEIVAKLHDNIHLVCKVNSLIPITVRWYKGVKALDDYVEFIQGGEIAYDIVKVDEYSSGTYTCVASNDKGSANSATKVIIPDVEPINDEPYTEDVQPLKLFVDSMA